MRSRDEFARLRAARERQYRRWLICMSIFAAVIAAAAVWLLIHPEALGHYVGRIANGYGSA